MSYRKEIEKIYKKIDTVAKRGEESYMDFIDLIDDLIKNNQYGIFDDVVLTKYNIDIKSKYKTVDDVKKNLFKELRFQTKTKFDEKFSTLLNKKNVFNNSFHFYDSITNKYLGTIKEIEIQTQNPYSYIDNKLSIKFGLTSIRLELGVGISSSIYEAIPSFNKDYKDREIHYVTYSQVIYDSNLYECINSYTWNYGQEITPTYSNYWQLSFVPTYSVSIVTTSSEDSLIDSYSKAIDQLKSYY